MSTIRTRPLSGIAFLLASGAMLAPSTGLAAEADDPLAVIDGAAAPVGQPGGEAAASEADAGTAARAAAAAAPAQAARGIEEVVVTARKREESLQDVPVAVTALSGEQLERQALTSIEKIAQSTPQLVVVRGTSGSGASLNLRGIGSSFTSIGIEQSVAVNVDGVYYGQGRIINEGFFDMKQVEILKGPQALFFGKNATAGVISFTSADPGDTFEVMARTGYELTAEQVIGEAMISGPLTDTFGMRLAVRASDMSGGYIENVAPATTYTTLDIANGFAATLHDVPVPERDVPGEEELVARLTAKYQPTERFSVTLKGVSDRYRIRNATWINEFYSCPSGSTQVNPGEACDGDWRIQQNDVPADIAQTNPLLNRHGGRLYQDYDSYSGTLALAYDADTLALSSVSGYHHFENFFLGDYDATGAADGGTWGAERSEYRAWSSEQRLQTTLDGPLNFMLGLYNQSTRLDFLQEVIFPGGLEDSTVADPSTRYITLRKISRTEGDTFALFGQTIWNFLPDWELAPGVRYTHETKRSFFTQPYVIAPFQTVFVQYDPADPTTRITADQTFDNLAPEVTLSWKPTEDLTLYGAYKRGFKSGGFSGSALYSVNTTVNDLAFDPEEASGIEAGVKSTLLDGSLRLNVAVYRYEYDDLQVDFFDAANIQFITQNAGSAVTQGIELDGIWAPPAVDGLTFTFSAAFNDAQYDEFRNAPCYGGQTPAQGCTIQTFTDPATGREISRPLQDLSGEDTAFGPEWVGSLRADYTRPLGAGLLLGLSAGPRYSSDYSINAFGNPLTRQDAYVMWDAGLRLGADSGLWELALIGKNLSEEYVLTYGQDAPSTGSGTGTPEGQPSDLYGNPVFPRTIQLQFTYRYE
jgi:iron complex outermembrane recepter protein